MKRKQQEPRGFIDWVIDSVGIFFGILALIFVLMLLSIVFSVHLGGR